MGELLDALAETDTGLLITVDEVRDDLDEMIQLASAFQHFVRERRKVALFMAGLPAHVSALLQDKSVSFLRRANFYNIGIVSLTSKWRRPLVKPSTRAVGRQRRKRLRKPSSLSAASPT